MKKVVIIVAGGQGTRMHSTLPKQFMLLAGKPVILHTIHAFLQADPGLDIIVALPEGYFNTWHDLCKTYLFDYPHLISPGGATRFHTVKKALEFFREEGLVAVHDAVRPLVSAATIDRCFHAAEKTGAAIPVMPLTESLRRVSDKKNTWANRNEYRTVQTPQVFKATLLRVAYRQEYEPTFTDDACVVERTGHPITLVDGNSENIKITTPLDLTIAEALISGKREL